jgi:hypothetical protein
LDRRFHSAKTGLCRGWRRPIEGKILSDIAGHLMARQRGFVWSFSAMYGGQFGPSLRLLSLPELNPTL